MRINWWKAQRVNCVKKCGKAGDWWVINSGVVQKWESWAEVFQGFSIGFKLNFDLLRRGNTQFPHSLYTTTIYNNKEED